MLCIMIPDYNSTYKVVTVNFPIKDITDSPID